MRLSGLFLFFAAFAYAEDEEGFFENTAVKMLTDEDWETYIEKNTKTLVMFYAPWCGHCKSLKPDFISAAKEMGFASLAAMDCTAAESTATCASYEVKGYPAIKWIVDGVAEDYQGGREKQAIINYVTDKGGNEIGDLAEVDFKKMKIRNLKKILTDRGVNIKGMTDKSEFLAAAEANRDTPVVAKKAKKIKKGSSLKNGMTVAQERRWKARVAAAKEGFGTEEGENGEVVHLIEEDWEENRKTNPKMFVMFYAPWCGHCKTLKPLFVAASHIVKETDPDVRLVAVECVTNPELCKKFKANSFPTIKVFTDVDTEPIEFKGARDTQGITEFIVKTFRPDEWVEKPFENDVTKWEENGAVVHVTDGHWETFRKENEQVFAMFYAPWCGHCKAMKPDWAEVSSEFENKLAFVAVDCDVEKSTCEQYDVKGFPTIKFFGSSDGDAEDYNGGRSASDFRSFAEGKVGADDEEADSDDDAAVDDEADEKEEL